jgi:hypothetical protein
VPSKSSHISAVKKAIIGGVATLLIVAGVISFVLQTRKRRVGRFNNRPSSRPSSAAILTPFPLTHLGATHRFSAHRNGHQQPQYGPLEAGSASSASSYSSPSSQSFPLFPIGFSAKELARIRAETLPPQPALTHAGEDSTLPQTPSFPVAATVRRTPTPPFRFGALLSQFDRLRHEVQQLRTEGFNPGAPPSYAEGNVE